MDCHQIISGACNAGDRCFAVGSVEGIPFTAYAAGCNIVILASNFERVQIIPGAVHNYVQINSLDCSTDTGKIAAAYENTICIFEPTPIIHGTSNHGLEYRWVQTGTFQSASKIACLSWNLEGTRLLTGGPILQLWQQLAFDEIPELPETGGITFEVGEPASEDDTETSQNTSNDSYTWDCVWSIKTATPVHHMAFSPDGTLFATAGHNDRLVKIWFENKNLHTSTRELGTQPLKYGFVYIAHPRAVTHLSWRQTSKYMPKGSVANTLITSCLDNICRVWLETVPPDDSLCNGIPGMCNEPERRAKYRAVRQKTRFVQRLKHMKTCFQLRRHAKQHRDSANTPPIPTLPSTYSVHDFHSFGYHGSGVIAGLHFHLAASINAETDIPLVPSIGVTTGASSTAAPTPSFVLHWLDNKEMHFSLQAESLLHELTKKVLETDDDGFGTKKKHLSDDGSQCESSGFDSSLDLKIESLLRDWHHSPDLLFSVHPIDGSFLIWMVEWLDEFHPGSFRQAQVSFSTRIPSAFPLGDAMSMSTNVDLYHVNGLHTMQLKEMLRNMPDRCDKSAESASPLPKVVEEDGEAVEASARASFSSQTLQKNVLEALGEHQFKNENSQNLSDMDHLANPVPSISMVSKHSNGTLNLWQLTFADKSKFSQVLSIAHENRASGHRFRVNDITCHPVLPLLLTTSHHNILDVHKTNSTKTDEHRVLSGFCSELILWRVDSVGPLGKSGGVNELARINSPEISAFSNVAWIPTLLPSSTLGNLSNSPSACFVASDGESLRVYQAVIDARTLLAEISMSERRSRMRAAASLDSLSSHENGSSDDDEHHQFPLHDKIKIVSEQSTARPGCIIQLDAIADATHDWQNTQFLHVFQEQLITGERTEIPNTPEDQQPDIGITSQQQHGGAMVDLHRTADFEEPFYIVVLERTINDTVVHMWRLVIASQPEACDPTSGISASMMYVPDIDLVQDDEEADRDSGTDVDGQKHNTCAPHVVITTQKVCEQALALPDGVEVIHAGPAAGHLSSASIYPACLAPYTIVTACSDSTVRFWKCNADGDSYNWTQWEMVRKEHESTIDVGGQPLNVCAAYSGRVACAYKYGRSFTRPGKTSDPESRYVNLCVAIYECESTGGSEWVLEDTIHLKNIHLPRIQIDPHLDLSVLYDMKYIQKKQRLTQVLHTFAHDEPRSMQETQSKANPSTLLAVPSFSTLQSLRKSITENGNTCPLTQKHLVQLDWVSKEDGSHILTVAVGSKIMLFTPVSSDLAQANMKAMKESQSNNRPLLRKASSLAQPHFVDEIRWMKLRKILLKTADGLPPLPMQSSWVRDGILVVGMDSEMHVYTQWKPTTSWNHDIASADTDDSGQDTRQLRDVDLRTLVQESSQRRLTTGTSLTHLSRVSSVNLQILSVDGRKKRGATQVGMDYMPDYGLFEASRIACPVLPQYHPKQLMELLNSGKIRWVKAILAHLVRCIGGPSMRYTNDDEEASVNRGWGRTRTLSVGCGVSGSPEPRGSTTGTNQAPEDMFSLDYAEIASIPPLPLWTLLAADRESASGTAANEKAGYDELFDGGVKEDSLDALLECDDMDASTRSNTRLGSRGDRDRRGSVPERQGLSHFGPRQGRTLSRLLTHTHLPGLSSLDQMHLLALADTVATCNSDLAERFAIDAAKSALAKENLQGVANPEDISTDSLDECGLRFLLAMKHYGYLLRCLPLAQRAQFQRQGVGTNNLAWAYHSESQTELLQLIPSYAKGDPKWSTLKELGVGWWLRSNTVLKTCVEKLAKAAYQSKQDPLDAAIYYLAMKKKSLVWGLYRSKRDEKMTAFFSNNFTEERWRKAALKNAFALLGKQRFEHAAAFFLLAGALRDAIEVCLNKLDDLQLAMVIARLYEGELDTTPPNLQRILYEEILGCDADGTNASLCRAHPDPFLRSMALWTLKEYQASLSTLLIGGVGSLHPTALNVDDQVSPRASSNNADPNVFNFYVYLRTHPLLIRHQIAMSAMDKKKASHVVLSGFSYGKTIDSTDRQFLTEDTITPIERQLYFTTAHGHFKAGCPALALDVLSKLPSKVVDTPSCNESFDLTGMLDSPSRLLRQNSQIDSGILQWDTPATTEKPTEVKADLFDWGEPVAAASTRTDDLDLKWDDDDNEADNASAKSDSKPSTLQLKLDSKENDKDVETDGAKSPTGSGVDIMAQQLKFIACLKILMEELSTLATGFEVDGGQLRYQLYIWLEHEVEALRQLCSYTSASSTNDTEQIDPFEDQSTSGVLNEPDVEDGAKMTLHEILMQEKFDFEAKVQRAAKRKRWLKANETLLRTLVSYCSLHGAAGGGLASVRMELVLLLQELQQEKTQQQLLSPLPFPTTLPLLSASVACSKTVVADPVRLLQAHAHDMLQTVVALTTLPHPDVADSNVLILRDLAVALSACIYQCLCDSDSFSTKHALSVDRFQNPGMESLARLNGTGVASHLVGGRRRLSTDEPVIATTPPSRWPGVASLRALLARERDDDAPRLGILLCESFVAVFSSLLVYALSANDPHLLYRLVAHKFDERTWSLLFGGGIKKLIVTATVQSNTERETENATDAISGVWNSLAKQRARLNQRLLGQSVVNSQPGSQIKEDKPTYREQFVPPVMSMVSFFLAKPEDVEGDYDSGESVASESDHESSEDEDVFNNESTTKKHRSVENSQHSDHNSHAWSIMRHALLKLVYGHLTAFLPITGLESHELPVSSPLIHNTLRMIARWQELARIDLESRGASPQDFIPGCFVETTGQAVQGPALHKYRQLLEPHNTPFSTKHAAASCRRLWNYLVRQEPVQDVFIRAVFGKKRSMSVTEPMFDGSPTSSGTPDGSVAHNVHAHAHYEPVRIIHKEQDSISAFCISQVNNGLISIATPREIQEMDISLLLEAPAWLEDECELDILSLSMRADHAPSSFLLIQTPSDRIPGVPSTQSNSGSGPASPAPAHAGQSGRGTTVIAKHKLDGVRRMCSHPLLALYLTGGHDGSVHLWEWGHTHPLSTPRPPGTFAKVTRVRFSEHGNKFGVADSDGNLSLWQLGLSSSNNRPFFTYQCHNKGISDFVFLGSCSLVASAGHSSENKNVSIWDTLLPQGKSLVTSFTCHEQGASSLIFAPQHQLLIAAGKKGDVSLFDVRARILRHKFAAHDSPVKCLAIDPHEDFFVTGASDGDIKVWSLTAHSQLLSFPGEHSRGSFFKNIGQGVSQIYVDAGGRLFSCGADGSMKVRQLPERDFITPYN